MLTKKLTRFRSLLIVLFTGCLVLFPSLLSGYFKPTVYAQSTTLPAAYVGVWEGKGAQSNEEWSILMALTPGNTNAIVGTMAYPSLRCGGELTLRRINTQSIELSEKLTYVGNCVKDGTVVLQPDSGEKLQYKWFYSNGKLAATGSVQKVSLK
ncbi:hypothetical protein [Nostoc sp. 'Peltigera membranacea cyanobiont' 232]|uniref:hypothetical protein n=1 Tax=Nostoc sp. 'Peltigera membranacea cyanobiont' 232 TaxID=2014531 RepID=UPI000B959593|nr:hypothetical protein [Nostoc sp. 'Peltigera membranacea cyanobiont' 232]OYE01148.1 hypothetical protein CDG79_31140 [Nostoc sp. 'Peltigera membranacea cyanobiont' 232]